MTGEKNKKAAKGQKTQKALSQARQKQQTRSKHFTARASNAAVNAFMRNLGSNDSKYELYVVDSAKGGGVFEVKNKSGTTRRFKIKSTLFLAGKMRNNPKMKAAIGPGSHVIVKDDEIVGVLGLRDALEAKRRLGWGNKERLAPEGFNFNMSNVGTRKRSGERSPTRRSPRGKLAAVREENEGGNNKNLFEGVDR